VEDDVDVWRYTIVRVACQKRRRRTFWVLLTWNFTWAISYCTALLIKYHTCSDIAALTELFCWFLEWCSLRVCSSRLRSVKHCHIFVIVIVLLKRLQFQLVIRHCYQPILATFAFLPMTTTHNLQVVNTNLDLRNNSKQLVPPTENVTPRYTAIAVLSWMFHCNITMQYRMSKQTQSKHIMLLQGWGKPERSPNLHQGLCFILPCTTRYYWGTVKSSFKILTPIK